MTNAIIEELKSLLSFQDDQPLTFSQAADYLNLSKSYLYKLTCTGQITFFKPNGKKIYFRKSDLNNFLFRRKNKSESELRQDATEFNFYRGK